MPYVVYFGFFKSREKGLVTKEYLIMNMHLNFQFKCALHFSILAIKLCNSNTELLQLLLKDCYVVYLRQDCYEPVLT